MNVFPIPKWNRIFLLAMFFLLTGCIESRPWQSYASEKPDAGQDTQSIEDVTVDLRADLEKGCSVSSCGQGLVCDSQKNICVSCTTDAHCNNGVCDDGVCVECVNHSDCPEMDKARCLDNVCTLCDSSVQCGHFPGALLCSVNGICECTTDINCGAGVCDRRPSSAGTCDFEATTSKGHCEECISDSQCEGGSLCVLTSFEDDDYKYFCLTIAGGACDKPYTLSGVNVRSLGGAEEEVCWPIQSRATCDAVVKYLKKKTCTTEADCPRSGLCENGKCTYACRVSGECDNLCSNTDPLKIGFCK